MKVDIIPIGNSRGIRIPKALLEQCGFGDNAELEVENNQLILSASKQARKDWNKAFKAMAAKGDDTLSDMPETAFDGGEWAW